MIALLHRGGGRGRKAALLQTQPVEFEPLPVGRRITERSLQPFNKLLEGDGRKEVRPDPDVSGGGKNGVVAPNVLIPGILANVLTR